jgi:hypothetical protein
MSKVTDLTARAARLTGKPADDVQDGGEERAATAPRAKDIRMTVDLSPGLYRKVWAYPEDMDLPAQTGRARIPIVEVFRALVEELAVNQELRKAVAKRIRANVSK